MLAETNRLTELEQAREALREALNWMEACQRGPTGMSRPAYLQQQRAIKATKAALRRLGETVNV